jgi:hypothetical protein
MARLFECPACRGLRHGDGRPCPHCAHQPFTIRTRRGKTIAIGLGAAIAACGPLPITHYGICANCEPLEQDAGEQDGSMNADGGSGDAAGLDGSDDDGGAPDDGGTDDGGTPDA